MDTFDPNFALDLLNLTGPLGSLSLVNTAASAAPEPASIGLLAIGLVSVVGFRASRRLMGRRAE